MANETLRERVATVLEIRHWNGQGCGDPHSPGACSNCFGPSPMTSREVADAALAVVADTPGLVEALRAHRLNFDMHGDSCQADDWTEDDSATFEDHLADVLRAWLRGYGA